MIRSRGRPAMSRLLKASERKKRCSEALKPVPSYSLDQSNLKALKELKTISTQEVASIKAPSNRRCGVCRETGHYKSRCPRHVMPPSNTQ